MNPNSVNSTSTPTSTFPNNPFANMMKTVQSAPNSDYSNAVMDKIRSGGFNDLAKQYGYDLSPFNTPTPPPITSQTAKQTPDNGLVGTFATNVNKDLTASGKQFAESITQVPQRAQEIGNKVGNQAVGTGLAVAEGGLRAAGATAGGLLSFANDAVRAIPGVDAFLNHVGQGFTKQTADNPNSMGAKLVQGLNDFTTKHPNATQDLGSILNVVGAVFGMKGLQSAGEKLPATIQGMKNTATSVVEGAKGLATSAKNTITGANESLSGKTMEQILATPENQIYKLTPTERNVYFDNARNQVTSKSGAIDAQIKADLATRTQASQAEAEALQRKVSVASRDETVALRPQIRTALAKQSATYRQLVDEEIAQHASTPVSATELKQFVVSRFPDNPGMAEAVNGKLGLTGERVAAPLASGELPTTELGQPIAHGGQFNPSQADTTIGKLYDQTKSLKGDIGSAATKGVRVYTADEKLTDDAIHTLSDFMKSKGVDLKDANSFWAKYAPVRNQLVSEAKPFLQTGTQTKTFANTLMRVAKGTDVNNENFIKSVEDILGKPVGADTKSAVSALSQSEKTQIANEVQAQTKMMENKLLKDTQLKGVSDKQFEIERQARGREIVRRVLRDAGLVGGGILGEEIIRRTL